MPDFGHFYSTYPPPNQQLTRQLCKESRSRNGHMRRGRQKITERCFPRSTRGTEGNIDAPRKERGAGPQCRKTGEMLHRTAPMGRRVQRGGVGAAKGGSEAGGRQKGDGEAMRGNPFPRPPPGVQGGRKFGPGLGHTKEGWHQPAFSCPKPGSNRHAFKGHWILSPARLPIPPSGLFSVLQRYPKIANNQIFRRFVG